MVEELRERCLDFASYTCRTGLELGYPMVCQRLIYIFVRYIVLFPRFCRDSLLTTDFSSPLLWPMSVCSPAVWFCLTS